MDHKAASRPAGSDTGSPLAGSVDRCTPAGVVIGWVWSHREPHARRRILFFADGNRVAEAIANQPRADLADAGIGDGAHGFEVVLPASAFTARPTTTVVVRDEATGLQIGADLVVDRAALDRRDAPPLDGNLDQVTPDGWVAGWCWYPGQPHHRVELAILVDGERVGTTLAANHRPDLEQHGVGDGAHGFSFALPWSVLTEKGELSVSVRDHEHGTPLGDPVTLRIGVHAANEARIQDLERQVRVLRSEIEGYARVAQGRDEDRAARDLFRTVAAFFQELADAPAEDGFASAGLRGTLAAFSERYAAIPLVAPRAPEATIIIDARAPTAVLHRGLRALKAAGADTRAEIVLLDDGGQGGEVALLPVVVGNLRYHRLAPATGLTAARNDAARDARGDAIIFLAGDAVPEAGWLDTLLETLARHADAAIVGSRAIRGDGVIDHAGLALDAGMQPRELGLGDPGDLPEYGFMRPVDAVADRGFAVRANAFRDAGGFAEELGGAAAVLDLCARVRRDGACVLYQPEALLIRADGAAADPPLDGDARRLLRRRWQGGAPPPHAFLGHALVVDSELPRLDRDAGSIFTFEQMLVLRDLGWRVTFAPADSVFDDTAAIALLQARGIEVARPSAYPSATAVLRKHGAKLDLVHVNRHIHGGLLIERARALAPEARIVFTPADLHYLREQREAAMTGRELRPEATRARELACVAAADATILMSDHEFALLAEDVAADRLVLLRWITEVRDTWPAFAARRDLCFVGNFRHAPNGDGVEWFAENVMPLVWRSLPNLVLHIVGRDPPAGILAMAGPRVVVHGWVPRLEPLLDQARLTVAPLRFGAGFKGKIALSLAHGVPVVGTSIAAEGTGLLHGDGMMIADTPRDFAAAIVSLYGDEAAWTALSTRGAERCRALYSPQAARAAWRGLLTRLGLPFLTP